MRRRLRRFASIGLIATAVDISVLVVMVQGAGLIVIVADAVALLVAASVSYVLNRQITFAGDPSVRWVERPLAFVLVATAAGVVDIAVLRAMVEVTGWDTAAELVAAKLPAIAVAAAVRVIGYRWILLGQVRADLAERVPRPVAPGTSRLSVVVPAYREADRIAGTVAQVRDDLGPAISGGGLEIVIVDDGSGDTTADVATRAGADQVIVLPTNRGKGAAVRAGVLAATGRTIAFTDADLSYAPVQILDLVTEVEAGWDMVVGSRVHTQTATLVRARRLRELGGRMINLCTHAVLLGAPRDTQCGLKAFRSDVARSLFSRTRVDGFAFDVELFHLAERDHLSVREVPVQVANTTRSSVRVLRDGLALVRDLVRVVRGSRAGWYDTASDVPAAPEKAEGVPEQGRRPMADLDAIFKAYDIRGTVPDQIDADVCRRIGAAFARFASETEGARRILIGRDMRESGVQFGAAFAEGAQAQGLDVIDLGMCSTDLVYFASGRHDAPGAMLTASHNPANYNGIKLCLAGAKAVGQDTGLERIKALAAAGVPDHPGEPGSLSRLDALSAFADHVRSFVDTSALAPLKVVADTANGMGGLVVPAVFAGLPCELDLMYGELDGTFPNHPADPIQVENQADLRKRVIETGADLGLAFDGDADRVFVVDEQGEPISGSTTTAMVAAGVLDKEPGATILHNLICSKSVPEIIRERGGTPVRTKVGHSFVKAVMAETGAAFGGEHSAHYYFRDNWRADSGLIAAVHVLEQRSLSGVPLSEMRKPFERYADSGEINTKVADPHAVIEDVAAAYTDAEQDRLDGLTVDLGSWWFNLRPSNTEPLLRLNLEASTRVDCDTHVEEVLSLITGSAGAGPSTTE